ncbi:MAG: hypothetical protein PHY29_02820 [Syntrophales bacterium]|nr:hypothetical protein [Syntrophales bacterium]
MKCKNCELEIEPVFKEKAKFEQPLWRCYEAEKARIQALNLSPREYEQTIKKLTRKLGI